MNRDPAFGDENVDVVARRRRCENAFADNRQSTFDELGGDDRDFGASRGVGVASGPADDFAKRISRYVGVEVQIDLGRAKNDKIELIDNRRRMRRIAIFGRRHR